MPKILIRAQAPIPEKGPAITQLMAGVFVYLTCMGWVFAQDVSGSSESLQLKLEDQLLVRPLVTDEEAPTFTSSKKVDGVVERQMLLEGEAVIRRNRTIIKGDTITYDPDTDIADVVGHAVLLKDSTSFKGPKAKLKVDAQEGWIDEPVYELRDIGGGGKANRVELLEDNQYEFEKLTYTTCGPENIDWYLSASRMEVDADRNSATGSNGVLHFFDIPILYTPAFALPVSSGRQSGFLSPTYGRVSRGNWTGWDITLPYYVNIAPNRDLTLFPRYLQGRGEQIGGEFRYLDRDYIGTLKAEYLSHDQVYGKDRWAFGIKHAQNLATGVVGYTDYSKVSDDLYVDDLGKSLNGVVNRQFTQEIGARVAQDGWNILTRVQKFQTLQPDPAITAQTSLPYEREPQVNAKYTKNNVSGFNFNFESDATRFTYPGRYVSEASASANGTVSRLYQQGDRAYINTSIARPFMTPGYYITPKISVRATQYSVTPFPGEKDINRNISLPTMSVDSGITFERDALELKPVFGRDMLMTLEPRLLYVYTPYRYQSDLPLFDTADAGFGVSQIFSENTFAGNDRVSDNNKVTMGVTSRILDGETGVERLRGVLAQRIDLTGQRVGLTSEQSVTQKKTDILAGLATRLAGNFNVDGVAQYSQERSKLVQQSITASYRPETRKLVNVSYRRTLNPDNSTALDQYEISGQWPIARNWYGVARYNYDLVSSKVLNRLVGLEYDADCWVVRVVQRRYQNTSVLATSEIYMQIDFKGFSGLGSNPINLIRFNVPGYEPISANPAPISPFERYE
jgi:LPS-assembly protein